MLINLKKIQNISILLKYNNLNYNIIKVKIKLIE